MKKTTAPYAGITVAKRMVYLAWQKSRCEGMGIFQDRGPQNEDAVWKQAYDRGDYPCGRINMEDGSCNADYVFGRMMKLYLQFTDNTVEFNDGAARSDYQSWAYKYPTFEVLFDAAMESLK
jgi:hypothetical protein